MRRVSLMLALVTAVACGGPTEIVFGESVTLSVGQAARVAGNDVELRFTGVSNDSRCPSDPTVDCVWEGDAIVELRVQGLAGQAQLELHTSPNLGRSADWGPYTIWIDDLTPLPTVEGPPVLGAYRLTLHVLNRSVNNP